MIPPETIKYFPQKRKWDLKVVPFFYPELTGIGLLSTIFEVGLEDVSFTNRASES